jgi:acetoin utilization deacetylase AcuC-like enzyme
MSMTEAGYGYLAAVMRDLANELCGGKLVLFLEGGYDLNGISSSMVEVIKTIDGNETTRPQGESNQRHARVLDETIEHLQAFWPTLK